MALECIDLTGKVALITGGGANGGIGHAIALGMAKFGADICVLDIDADGASITADEVRAMGRRAEAVTADVSKEADMLRAFGVLDRQFGQIDILVNNAFAAFRVRPEDLSLEQWNRVMGVNTTGYFLAAREAGRRIIKRGKGGCVINISSIGGSLALGRGNFVYSVGKGAINQFTRELAVEWGHYGIRVNAIQPAQTLSPYVKQVIADSRYGQDALVQRFLVGIPLGRLGQPEDIAGPAIFLASDLAAWVTGVILPVDGGNLAMNAGGSHTWPSEADETTTVKSS